MHIHILLRMETGLKATGVVLSQYRVPLGFEAAFDVWQNPSWFAKDEAMMKFRMGRDNGRELWYGDEAPCKICCLSLSLSCVATSGFQGT